MTTEDGVPPVEPGPTEPELDEYGVPIKPKRPAKAAAYLAAAYSFIVAAIVVVAYIQYGNADHPHQTPPAGPRLFALASGLLGVTSVVLRVTILKKQSTSWALGRIRVLVAVAFAITAVGSFWLLWLAAFPHACENGGCNG